MLARILVPLQYLYLCWRAEKLAIKAGRKGPGHVRAMARAEAASASVETLQIRFREITYKIDNRRRNALARSHMAS